MSNLSPPFKKKKKKKKTFRKFMICKFGFIGNPLYLLLVWCINDELIGQATTSKLQSKMYVKLSRQMHLNKILQGKFQHSPSE